MGTRYVQINATPICPGTSFRSPGLFSQSSSKIVSNTARRQSNCSPRNCSLVYSPEQRTCSTETFLTADADCTEI